VTRAAFGLSRSRNVQLEQPMIARAVTGAHPRNAHMTLGAADLHDSDQCLRGCRKKRNLLKRAHAGTQSADHTPAPLKCFQEGSSVAGVSRHQMHAR
jgi:hypothetical protein